MSKKKQKKLVLRKKVKREGEEDDVESTGEEEEVEEEVDVEDEETPEEPAEEPAATEEPEVHIPSFLESHKHEEPKHEPKAEHKHEEPKHEPKAEPKGKGKKSGLSDADQEVLNHLQFIKDYKEVTVPQFRAFADLGDDARRVLDEYIAQDLLEEVWRDNIAGRYFLTELGEKRRLELGGPPAPEA